MDINPLSRTVTFADGASLSYDLAVLDVESRTAMPEIEGFALHVVPIKPMQQSAARLQQVQAGASVAIIGGGVAGAEVALALHQSLPVTLIERGPAIATTLGGRSRSKLQSAVGRAGVVVLTQAEVAQVTDDAVILSAGQRVDHRDRRGTGA